MADGTEIVIGMRFAARTISGPRLPHARGKACGLGPSSEDTQSS